MKITLGFSPCPNDTFIFDALVNKKIDTKGIDFEVCMEDVETLNIWALEGKLDVTKLSYAVYFKVYENYILLNSGSALGKGVGPLLISKYPLSLSVVEEAIVAIPGENTTAHMLFSLVYPKASNKVFLRYDEIENFVCNSSFKEKKLGVIIHENRFTYEQKGLLKIIDLGEYWENKMKVPIPLGGIAIKRSISLNIQKTIDSLMRESIVYAFKAYPTLSNFIKQHAQAMNEAVMRQHIDLYVNNYSIDLGNDGRHAIDIMAKQLLSSYINSDNLFINSY